MTSLCKACLTKDQLIIAQSQIIDELRQKIAALSGASSSVSQFITPGFHLDDGYVNFPDFHESLSQINHEQHLSAPNIQVEITPIRIVGHNSSNIITTESIAATESPSTSQDSRPKRIAKLPVPIVKPKGPVSSIATRKAVTRTSPESDAGAAEPATSAGFDDDSDHENLEVVSDLHRIFNKDNLTHVLVLGTPHTRKAPLRCPLDDCPHKSYRAWDRDLLKKHFEKYHADTHPNPVFNFLCPVDGCPYISYNEPAYTLFTHIKFVHRDFLADMEKRLAENSEAETGFRNLKDFQYDKLPSEITRNTVRIKACYNMAMEGMRCPLASCATSEITYKASAVKRLQDHFERVHSFTHPNPDFIFVCPVAGCRYESDVGQHRVYRHIKATHKEYAAERDAVRKAHGEEESEPTTNKNKETSALQSADESPDDENAPLTKTTVIMKASHNMSLDPLKCPIEGCPVKGFNACSLLQLKRHYKRYHFSTHPNPTFYFTCPVKGCLFLRGQEPAKVVWRHLRKSHPEYWRKLESDMCHPPTLGAASCNMDLPIVRQQSDPDKEIRAEAALDPTHPDRLLWPPRLRCCHTNCRKLPMRAADKTQILKHYNRYHPQVERTGTIHLFCPFDGCNYTSVWPPKALLYHVETVHGVSKLQAKDRDKDATVNLVSQEKEVESGVAENSSGVAASNAVRIVGRPLPSGAFWCPLPNCGFSEQKLQNLRGHIIARHRDTHPNPVFVYVCPIPGCSFSIHHFYSAVCNHMQKEHGLKKAKPPQKLEKPGERVDRRTREYKRKAEQEANQNAKRLREEETETEAEMESGVIGDESGIAHIELDFNDYSYDAETGLPMAPSEFGI